MSLMNPQSLDELPGGAIMQAQAAKNNANQAGMQRNQTAQTQTGPLPPMFQLSQPNVTGATLSGPGGTITGSPSAGVGAPGFMPSNPAFYGR